MTTAAWVMIGCALFTQAAGVVWWLVRRPVGRIDRLEAAVFGESGVHMRLNRYVTTEAFEKRMGTIDSHLHGVSEEGQRREERILGAIQEQTRLVSVALTEVRTDVRQQSQRIDAVMQQRNGER